MLSLTFSLFLVTSLLTRSFGAPANCMPTNWNYAWSKVGNVWFTRTRERGDWQTMAEKCQNIEPGRSSMASIRSPAEQRNVVTNLPDEDWWIGGVRLGGPKWYWASLMKNKMTVTPMQYTNWDLGEPNNYRHEYCMHMYGTIVLRKWNDINCLGNYFRAICEIRCTDKSLPPEL